MVWAVRVYLLGTDCSVIDSITYGVCENEEVCILHTIPANSGMTLHNQKFVYVYSVADLGGVPRVPWNPLFGFSCDRKLGKPGF